jgi:hypothetical protein
MHRVFEVGFFCKLLFTLLFSEAKHKSKRATRNKKKKEFLPVNGATEAQPLKLDSEPEQQEESASVLWAIARTFKLSLLAGALYKFIFDVVQFGFPQLLKLLISFVEKGTEPTWYGVVIAASMFLLATAQSLVSQK